MDVFYNMTVLQRDLGEVWTCKVRQLLLICVSIVLPAVHLVGGVGSQFVDKSAVAKHVSATKKQKQSLIKMYINIKFKLCAKFMYIHTDTYFVVTI